MRVSSSNPSLEVVEDLRVNRMQEGLLSIGCNRGLAAPQPALHNFQTFAVLGCLGGVRAVNRSEQV